MMFRTYGRRGRGLTRSFSGGNSFADGISDSSSPERPEDAYDFTLPSQESTGCDWSDPHSFRSSQETGKLAFLPPGKGGDCNGGYWKSKKVKLIDVDSEPYGSSSEELKEFEVLEVCERDFKKSKKVNSDPYEYNSSQDAEEFVVRPQKKGRETSVFDFSEEGDLWKIEEVQEC